MKSTLFLLIVSFNIFHAQEITDSEYEIYAQEMGQAEYKIDQFELGIPEKYQHVFLFKDDSISQKINKLASKNSYNSNKLVLTISKYQSINKKYKRLKFDRTEKMFCSPIYFKTNNEAYFFLVIDGKNLPKPIYAYLVAYRKRSGLWQIEDFYTM